jgi:ABC-type lipoprotein export system ATPase subunit
MLEAKKVRKTYVSGESTVEALRGVSLRLEKGDFVALMGPSGCGKSTLLHLCGAMDRASAGEIFVEGKALHLLDDTELTRLRRERLGFVFQFFNLLPTLTVAENVSLPLLLSKVAGSDAEERSCALLDRVGLLSRKNHYPSHLSGGEMQRAAIARALVHKPALLVADEPTGNLDSENGTRIIELLSQLNLETGTTLLLATHSSEIASAAKRVVQMRDGKLMAG